MANRPPSASLPASSAALPVSTAQAAMHHGAPTSAAMPAMSSEPPMAARGPVKSSAALKNFGPPTLQSDTVVFQAAKIPQSFARAASTPGAVLASPNHVRAPHRRDHAAEMYGTPPPGLYMGSSPEVQQRRPPPQPRDAGHDPRANGMVSTHPQYSQHPHNGASDGLVTGSNRSVAGPSTKPKAQRSQRASSADSKRAPRRVVRLTIRVVKEGDKLGFGIRNDSNRKLKVSTLQSNSTAAKSELKIGDTILTVNGVDLTHLGFLEVIQQLKATRPGELVFDIERSLDDDEPTSETGSQVGETMDLDSPLSVAEKRFGPAGMATAALAQAQGGSRQPSPSQVGGRTSRTPPHGTPVTPPATNQPPMHAVRVHQRTPPMPQQPVGTPLDMAPPPMAIGPSDGAIEQPRKRPRPSGASAGIDFGKMDKEHKAALLELKKERAERLNLEEKNTALRKRLQNMLIECDEVRVRAASTVAAIKDQAQHDILDLKQALQAAKAQLRLQDRGPDVARTDSIISDLMSTKEQFNRLRKLEMDRATGMSNRYSYESRQAEREAHRVRDRLIVQFQTQLREAARRHYSNTGAAKVTAGKDSSASRTIIVQYEGLRRLAFVKLFGLPCSYEWYISDDFFSTSPMEHSLSKPDDVMDVFGNTLCHEERAGLFLIANAPINVTYDPAIEKITLSCSWVEQNQLRELARNFRF